MLISAGMGIGLMFWSRGRTDLPLPDVRPRSSAAEAETPRRRPTPRWSPPSTTGVFHPWGYLRPCQPGAGVLHLQPGAPADHAVGVLPAARRPDLRLRGATSSTPLRSSPPCSAWPRRSGFGVKQVSAGTELPVRDLPDTTAFQVVLIAVITGMAATMSVIAGLDGGVKRLSAVEPRARRGVPGVCADRRTDGVHRWHIPGEHR